MSILQKSRNWLVFVICTGVFGIVHATEIYRWTDENGVVHFSQTAPPPAQDGVSQLSLADDRPSSYDPDEDIFGVAEQEARMQALREEREQKRQERLERQQAAARLQPQPQQSNQGYWDRPVYWYPGNRPRPPLRPMPPIERPPPGPGAPIRPPRPITPRLD